ncbi:MAG: peptide transporter permease [Glaciihabitans sp.]|nr:peptide transporter permease [Glaciihabitans sp.]
MFPAIFKRLLAGIPTLLAVALIVFLILRLVPGDPIRALLASSPATPGLEERLRTQFGLDRPLPEQFISFIWNALHGDLGLSYTTRQPVTSAIGQQLMPTLQLALAATVLTAVLGITLGVLAATYRNTLTDGAIRVFSLLGTSMPSFWVGLLLIMLVAFQLRLLPATGSGGFDRLILPAITLALPAAGVVTRIVRNNVLDVLGENFVTALRAKGIGAGTIMVKHVLRNAIIPAVTVVGMQIGVLLAGAVIVEQTFARQGIGKLLVQSILSGDYPIVQGIVLLIAAIYILVNIAVDITYTVIDPRIRLAAGANA